jgi:VanZ family protein
MQRSGSALKLVTILYAGFFLTILVLAYTGHLPTFLTGNDKLGHVVLYGIATYLGHRLLKYRRITMGHLGIPLFPLLFGLWTVIEEGLQSLSPNRTLDSMDLVCSFLGIAIGYWLAQRLKPSKSGH